MNVFDPLPEEVAQTPLDKMAEELEQANFPNLGGRTQFCRDLAAKVGSKFSPKQEWWLRYMYGVALGLIVDAATPKLVEVGNFEGVYALFEKAKAKLKWPQITLQTPQGQEVMLKPTGQYSKNAGSLNVTDGKPYGQNIWFGAINEKGEWKQNTKLDESTLFPVARLLKKLAADPVATAKAYGLLTGRCCFCNKHLEHEKSTAAGFGETCAKHFGLHEEWKKANAVLKVAAEEQAGQNVSVSTDKDAT